MNYQDTAMLQTYNDLLVAQSRGMPFLVVEIGDLSCDFRDSQEIKIRPRSHPHYLSVAAWDLLNLGGYSEKANAIVSRSLDPKIETLSINESH